MPVRLFLTPGSAGEAEDGLYPQIVNATRFPGVKLVVITPDAHYGYGVPVGSVILTDGTLAMGPVGYDIGCGMMSRAAQTLPPRRQPRPSGWPSIARSCSGWTMGAGGREQDALRELAEKEFNDLIRGGADYYLAQLRRARSTAAAPSATASRWTTTGTCPGAARAARSAACTQLGSLGGGNHFIELQRCEETGTLFVQVHTGSRGFGHGLATNYFDLARADKRHQATHIDLGYFTPDSPYHRSYLNAVAAGGNFAIINRLILFQQIAAAFRSVFRADLELIYEISHNLVQREWHPDYGEVWVHRKGATRAFPAGHPALAGTLWQDTGHPVLIPGSNRDYSYILRPLAGAVDSGFSVNHGAGRRHVALGGQAEAVAGGGQPPVPRRRHHRQRPTATCPLDESDACYKPAAGSGRGGHRARAWPRSSTGSGRSPRSRGRIRA